LPRVRRTRSRKKLESSSSDSDRGEVALEPTRTVVHLEKGIEENRLPIDISSKVGRAIADSNPKIVLKTVRFDDVPVVIKSNPDIRIDEYDIIRDIKDQKANVTIGQLLHDNANYQKLIREAWTRRRKKKFKLPSVAVNFSQPEDFGAPEVTVEVEGCSIPKVPVDGESGVNLMLEEMAFDLGYTAFEATDQVLRMADQSRVNLVRKLSQVPTRIGGVTYLLNFVIIRVQTGRPFPMLLGRPWLYSARVLVDWGAKEFVIGKPSFWIPWTTEKHLGETSDSDGYTMDWSEPKDSDSIPSYFVDQFGQRSKEDFGFHEAVREYPHEEPTTQVPEDRSLGESSIPLTSEWIHQQLKAGNLPPSGTRSEDAEWGGLLSDPEEAYLEKIKTVVSSTDYEKEEVERGKTFYISNDIKGEERAEYAGILKEYFDVFAWAPTDLEGIPAKLGEHSIDFQEGAVPVRQRQYRLNPRYSLMVKEETDRLLEAGFIYPVNNSEWVSPIVVVPKKVGADGKVNIRVCQDFRKLNSATKKEYFPLPFTDIILDHVAGHQRYSFLDGFSGYNQVFIQMSDQLKTTFTMEWGSFAFNRMPFGLCNAPGTFQRLMMDIFKDFLTHFLEVFIDDSPCLATRKII
jgi:hypothetical protein